MAHTEKSDLNRSESLPQYYAEDRLVILPRDPYSIFAYWELSLPTREALKKEVGAEQWPGVTFLLRVSKYAWSDEEAVESYYDLNVSPGHDNWYISVQDADRLYHVELGSKLPQGSFQTILRSNSVRTPRDSLSDLIDEEWQLPDWKAQKLFRRITLYHLSSAEFFRRPKQLK